MQNINILNIELSQPTDSKAVSVSSSESGKDNASLFSNLMDQQKEQANSGKNAANGGKEEQNSPSPTNSAKKNQSKEVLLSSETKHECDKLGNHQAEQGKNNLDENSESINKSDEIATDPVDTQAVQTQQKSDTSVTNPEQLLSFLNASENTLNTKGNSVDHNAKMGAEKILSQIERDLNVLKTDKTLIAQSVSKPSEADESIVLQPIKSLLKPEKLEGEVAIKLASQSVVDTNNKEATTLTNHTTNNIPKNDKSILSPLTNTSGEHSSKAGEGHAELENVDSEMMNTLDLDKVVTEVKLQGVSDIDKKPVDKELSSLINKTSKDKSFTESLDKGLNSVLEATDNATAESTNIKLTAVASEQVVTQVKSQEVNKEINKTDNTLANAQQNKESSANVNQENISSKALEKNDYYAERNKEKIQPIVDAKVNPNIEVNDDKAFTNDEELTVKDSKVSTDNIVVNQKINTIIDPLLQREMKNAQSEDRFIHNELSFNNVMQTMSADLAQTQKNAIIQQTETISIMRKDFTDAVKDKVMVMINQKIQQIEIQLDPPELGNVQVRINMQNDQAVVNFIVQNQQAKEALEQNMDKLKHMMADSGVDVGGADVQQQSNQSATQDNEQSSDGQFHSGEDDSTEHAINIEHAQVMKASSMGVDYYA